MVLVSKIGVLLSMMRIKQPKDKTPTTHAQQGTTGNIHTDENLSQLGPVDNENEKKCMYINK